MKQSLYKLTIKNIIAGIFYIMLSSLSFAIPNTEGIQVYQKNIHHSEEHKQKLAADIYRYHNADNIWDQLRNEFALPHYEESNRVQEQIMWFLDHQEFLQNAITRASPYLYFILQQVHRRHLPAEVVLLPIMESSYNPFACSPMGAMGIWQMMPGTASGFGIKQNWWYDGRRDVIASTKAALDYLSYLGDFFDGNWLLSIAAYDTGEGNVLSAIRRNIRDGLTTDYWSLPLAQETQIYIPRLLALASIITHPEKYPITFPSVRNAPYLAQIDIGAQIDLKHAAQLAGLSLNKLKQLNPGYNRSVTDPHGPFKIVLPIEHVEQFSENLEDLPLYQRTNWIHYKVKSGDTLSVIAKRFNTTKSTLLKNNPIVALNLKPGKSLVIPRSVPSLSKTILESHPPVITANNNSISHNKKMITAKKDTTQKIANALENLTEKYTLKPGDTLYMMRKGDDLQKVANQFHTTVKTLLVVNQLNSANHILPGKKIIIPTHLTSKDSSQQYQLASGDTVYMVKQGDNIQKIAQKYHTTPSAIRLANLLTTNDVTEGDQLLIPTHIG